MTARSASTVVIAASIIAAVRLARGSGHQQIIASFNIGRKRQHRAREKDSRWGRARRLTSELMRRLRH